MVFNPLKKNADFILTDQKLEEIYIYIDCVAIYSVFCQNEIMMVKHELLTQYENICTPSGL